MAIKATTPERDLVPEGNHIARVYSIIHEGVIPGEYQGVPNELDKVRIRFELPTETKVFKEGEEPMPFSIEKQYTLSMGSKSNLRPVVEGIVGSKLTDAEAYGFDIADLMGRACMLNVVHALSKKGTQYAAIQGTAPLPKGIQAPPQVNPPFILDFDENWSEDKFNVLPLFIREEIASSNNYKRKFSADTFGSTDTHVELTRIEDLPF